MVMGSMVTIFISQEIGLGTRHEQLEAGARFTSSIIIGRKVAIAKVILMVV